MTREAQTIQDGGAIRPLTALRFFAAFWVVLFSYWRKLGGPVASMLVQKGYLGVELFFILSDFVLCHVYLKGFGDGHFTYRSFLWSRLARVYPLHLATLTAMGALAVVAGKAFPDPPQGPVRGLSGPAAGRGGAGINPLFIRA